MQHRPVQVDQIQEVDYIRQICRPTIEQVAKDVPYIETQGVEREVQVPVILREDVVVEVPEIQEVQAMRQVQELVIQKTVVEVPRVTMKYVEKADNRTRAADDL